MARPPIRPTPTTIRPTASVVRPPTPISIGDGQRNRAQATIMNPAQAPTAAPAATTPYNSRGLGKAQTRATIAPAANVVGGQTPVTGNTPGALPNTPGLTGQVTDAYTNPANLGHVIGGVQQILTGNPGTGIAALLGPLEAAGAGANVRNAIAGSGLAPLSSYQPQGTLAQRTQQFNTAVNNRFFGTSGGRNIPSTLASLANLPPPGGSTENIRAREEGLRQAYRALFEGAEGGASISETEFRRLVNGGHVKPDGTIDWVGAAQAGIDLGFDMQEILANDPTLQPASFEDLAQGDRETAEAEFNASLENQGRANDLAGAVNAGYDAQSMGLDAVGAQAQTNAGEVQGVARGMLDQAGALPGQVEADFAGQIQATEQMVTQQLDGFMQSIRSGQGIIDQAKADALNVAMSTYTQQTADAVGAMDVQQRNTEAQIMGDLTLPPSERAKMVAMSRLATSQNKGDAAQRVVETHNKMVTDILGTFGGHLSSYMATAASTEGGLRQQGISNVAGMRQSAAERMAATRQVALEMQNTAGTLLNTASNELNSTLLQLETTRSNARTARDTTLTALLPEQATPWFDSYGLMDRDWVRRIMGPTGAAGDQQFFADQLNMEFSAQGIEAQARGPYDALITRELTGTASSGGGGNDAQDAGAIAGGVGSLIGGAAALFSDSGGKTVTGTYGSATSPVAASSDRNAKDVGPRLDPAAVLDAILTLPVYKWRYKGDSVEHIGPMAQDTHAALGVGEDKVIHMAEMFGSMVLCVQELSRQVDELKSRLNSIRRIS